MKHDDQEQLDTASGVMLELTAHVVVSGNTFSGLVGPALKAQETCRGILIAGNVATDLYRRAESKPEESTAFDIAQESGVTVATNVAD